MVAQVTGLKPGDFIHTLGDAHIYKNHFEQTEILLQRIPYTLPQMKLNPQISSIFDFTYEDFKLVGYESHPHIKAEVSI